jgi:hypothetical protein
LGFVQIPKPKKNPTNPTNKYTKSEKLKMDPNSLHMFGNGATLKSTLHSLRSFLSGLQCEKTHADAIYDDLERRMTQKPQQYITFSKAMEEVILLCKHGGIRNVEGLKRKATARATLMATNFPHVPAPAFRAWTAKVIRMGTRVFQAKTSKRQRQSAPSSNARVRKKRKIEPLMTLEEATADKRFALAL